MTTAAARVQRLERSLEDTRGGWEPYDPLPCPDLEGDGVWAKLKRIRDNHSNPAVRNMSLMDMAEDLIPGFKERIKRAGAAYEASHEWRWINGQCYVRERSERAVTT